MRYSILIFLSIAIVSCETNAFKKDNRQIVAKNQVRRKLPQGSKGFSITSFKEDTLETWTDTLFKKPIRYSLNFEYRDSAGLEKRTAQVIFTPDGRSVIATEIMQRNQ